MLHTPDLEADPEEDGTRTGTFVVLHPGRTELLVGGTFYAGEIKKSIFTVMNDRLPLEGVFPMHCSANVGADGRVAVFFGLSGTGKTTLSADPERSLIGDDEHGWGDNGVFNIEGGCYAKVIRLSADGRAGDLPDDADVRDDPRERRDRRERRRSTSTTTRRPRTRAPRTSSSRSRTRCRRRWPGHPSSVDLPDRRRLRDPAADREADARAGALLLPLRLHRQARRHRDRRHRAAADVLDLLRPAVPAAAAGGLRPACSARSWTSTARASGSSTPAGRAGRSARAAGCRSHATRAMLHAALSGELDGAEFRTDEVFGFEVPVAVPGVDSKLLDPRSTWADPDGLRRKARELAADVRRELRSASATSSESFAPPARGV